MSESKAEHSANHIWHVWMNTHPTGEHDHSLYEFKDMLQFLSYGHTVIAKAYAGQLPVLHQQCSHQAPVEIKGNALKCCLQGMDVTKCPILLSLKEVYEEHKVRRYPFNGELANPALQADDEQLYRLMAKTCAWHIFKESTGTGRFVDTSEGYLLDESDHMYWSNLYSSLAAGDEIEVAE